MTKYYNELYADTKGYLHFILCCILAYVLTYATYHLISHFGYFDNVAEYPMKPYSIYTMKEKIQQGTWFLLCIFWIAVIVFLNGIWMFLHWAERMTELDEKREMDKALDEAYADLESKHALAEWYRLNRPDCEDPETLLIYAEDREARKALRCLEESVWRQRLSGRKSEDA